MEKILTLSIFYIFYFNICYAQKPILTVNSGHTGPINKTIISKDGKFIFTASEDNTIKMWNAISGKEIKTFIGHTKIVYDLILNIKGDHLVSASGDHTVKIWNIKSGKEVLSFNEHTDFVSCLAISPDDKRIVSGQGSWPEEPNHFILWDFTTGKKIKTFHVHTESVKSLAFSGDGKYIISGSNDKTIRKWEVSSGKEIHTYRGHTAGVKVLKLSPDGQKILSGSLDASLKLWDFNNGNLLKSFTGHTAVVNCASFSKDGKFIVSGEYKYNRSGDIKLWNTSTGKEIKTFKGHSLSVSSVQFLMKQKYILSGSHDRTIKLWDIESGKNVRTYQGQTTVVNSVNISADGKRLLSASEDNSLKLWDIVTGRLIKNITTHDDMVYHVASSPNGNYFASASYDNTIKLWETNSGREVRTFAGHTNIVQSTAFSPDNKLLVSASADKTLKIFDVTSGKEVKTLKGHYGWVERVVFSPDGSKIASASRDKSIIIWDVTSGKILKRLQGHQEKVYSVAYSPDGKYIVSGGGSPSDQGNDVILWDANTGQIIRKLKGHTRFVNHAIFSPDGKQIISASADNKINIWETKTGKLIKTLKGHTRSVYNLVFNPEGNQLISNSHDGSIKFWSYLSGKLILTLYGFNDSEDFIAVTPDRYYTTSKNGTKMIHYTIGNKTFGFDQFDLQYNRPDIVAQRLGNANKHLINSFKAAYIKRLKKMGFKDGKVDNYVNGNFDRNFNVPEIKLDPNLPLYLKTNNKSLSLNFEAFDPKSKTLERLFVKINGVPIFGVKGKTLGPNSGNLKSSIKELKLSNGNNKIEVSVLNSEGVMSLTKPLEVDYQSDQNKNDLYVVSIGVSKYSNVDMNLDYAAKDAADLSSLLKNQTRRYNNISVFDFFDKKAIREDILKTKEVLKMSKVDDEVIIFIAGHGVLDENLDYYFATSNMDFENPAISGLKYEELESLLDGIPARKKLMLIDACHSGEVDKDAIPNESKQPEGIISVSAGKVKFRGFKNSNNSNNIGLQNSFELMKELFTDLRSSTGAIVISSASGAEFAFESSKWNNGVFTFAILEGIKSWKSDKNGDRKIKVSELKDYVTKRVVELTQGKQHPTSRKENPDYDFEIWTN